MSIRNRVRPLGLDGLPEGYTRCEYLEGTGSQHIKTLYNFTQDHGVYARYSHSETNTNIWRPIGVNGYFDGKLGYVITPRWKANNNYWESFWWGQINILKPTPVFPVEVKHCFLGEKTIEITNANGIKSSTKIPKEDRILEEFTLPPIHLFSDGGGNNQKYFNGRIFSAKISYFTDIVQDFIPALDPSGRPCMFDLVTQTPFYNENTSGSDFLYKAYSYPFNPSDNWHTVNKKIKEIIGSTKYTLELVEDGN